MQRLQAIGDTGKQRDPVVDHAPHVEDEAVVLLAERRDAGEVGWHGAVVPRAPRGVKRYAAAGWISSCGSPNRKPWP